MPRKKVRKEKNREYLENLLDKVGVTDLEIAKGIKEGMGSPNSLERSKAMDLAAKWKGFYDVDKKANDEQVEYLPIGNISAEDIMKFSHKCDLCKHCFESKEKIDPKLPVPDVKKKEEVKEPIKAEPFVKAKNSYLETTQKITVVRNDDDPNFKKPK